MFDPAENISFSEEGTAEYDKWFSIALNVDELRHKIEVFEKARSVLNEKPPVTYLSDVKKLDKEIASIKNEIVKLENENRKVSTRCHDHIKLIEKIAIHLKNKGSLVNTSTVFNCLEKFGELLAVETNNDDRSFSYMDRKSKRKIVSFKTLEKRVSEIKRKLSQ